MSKISQSILSLNSPLVQSPTFYECTDFLSYLLYFDAFISGSFIFPNTIWDKILRTYAQKKKQCSSLRTWAMRTLLTMQLNFLAFDKMITRTSQRFFFKKKGLKKKKKERTCMHTTMTKRALKRKTLCRLQLILNELFTDSKQCYQGTPLLQKTLPCHNRTPGHMSPVLLLLGHFLCNKIRKTRNFCI